MQLRECAQDASAPPPPVDPVYLVGASAQAIHAEARRTDREERGRCRWRRSSTTCLEGEDSSRVTAGARAAHWRSNQQCQHKSLCQKTLFSLLAVARATAVQFLEADDCLAGAASTTRSLYSLISMWYTGVIPAPAKGAGVDRRSPGN